MFTLLLACDAPDPDALLRAHDLDGAAAAHARVHGEPLDTNHLVADVLARRAAVDPSITTTVVAETVAAVRLLEASPDVGLRPLDLPVSDMAAWFGGLEGIAVGEGLVAVGRSGNGLDRDPYQGGALPWGKNSRLVGFARRDFAALGVRLATDPAPRLLTVAVRDDTGALTLTFTGRDGAWWSTAATDAHAGARLVLAGTLAAEQGASAAITRYGKGWVGG